MGAHIEKVKLKNGSAWRVVVEVGVDNRGKRKRIYRNIKGTKAEAQKLMAKLMNEIDTGTFIKPGKITVADLLKEWLKNHVEPNLSQNTQDIYKANVANHINPELGGLLLQDLRPMHLQRFFYKKLSDGRRDGEGGLSSRTVAGLHKNLHSALDFAVRMELIPRNVADLVKPPKMGKFEPRVYNEEEIITLLSTAKGSDMEIPVFLSVLMGLRKGEALGLRWSDVDFENRRLSIKNNVVETSKGVHFSNTKTKSSERTLDTPDSLVILLKKQKKAQAEEKLKLGNQYVDKDLVYCKADGSPYAPKAFRAKFKRFLRLNGLPELRFHDLRHSNATLMLKYGVNPKVAAQRLGHANISTTLNTYSHVIDNMQREAADKIEQGIMRKLDPQIVNFD